jgi:hypothetical protein
MRNVLPLLLLGALCLSTASAQEPSVVFHPGDTIHILIAFKKPPITIESASFNFIAVGQPDKAQELLNRSIGGNQLHKISDVEYEISGTIPDHIVSGRYSLNYIHVAAAGVSKPYAAGNDFKELTITTINPEHPEFPAIDDVKLAPHK